MTGQLPDPYWPPSSFTVTVPDPCGPGQLNIGVTVDERVPRGIALIIAEGKTFAWRLRDVELRNPPVPPLPGTPNPWAELRAAALESAGKPPDYVTWHRLLSALEQVRDLPAPDLPEAPA